CSASARDPEAPRAARTVDASAEGAQLMQRSRDWSLAVGRGDFEAALAYWSDNAVLMAPGLPPLRGKEAIREYVQAAAKLPGFKISWEPLEVHVSASGDMAYMVERNEISVHDASGAPITEHNKVVTVWMKQPDGSWQNVVDMWNAMPPPTN
ncbi:MAG: DUF4440 domain-containing protein, partial [Myxococcota bacterium]|nr:DUF4440 domain-containing protein [Myxococcota bacterium]